MTARAASVPAAAAWLGGLGVIPFAVGAAGTWLLDAPMQRTTVLLLCAYAAVILSFMGAIHWGLAMASGAGSAASDRRMMLSVVPALVAWGALSLPPVGTLTLMAAGFIGVYVLDAHAVRDGIAPAWYRRLRVPLTLAVLACLLVAVSGLLVRTGG